MSPRPLPDLPLLALADPSSAPPTTRPRAWFSCFTVNGNLETLTKLVTDFNNATIDPNTGEPKVLAMCCQVRFG